ncbi:hypothetical protein GF386_05380 [Candidatus Pacearchaeota archaeon]|nr:hypothetical protein [Candidatus Pacearchaeota archaeon]MBD3283520.1 hypothetical protein [Candidatus Pacearchaeota archaeon]
MKKNHSEKLQEFTEKLKNMPEIKGVYYDGSTAEQSWDIYSDIDIGIFVKDKDYKKILNKIQKLLSWWGEIKLYNTGDFGEHYAFVGNDYFKVEIGVNKQSELKPSYEFKNIKIAFDKTGYLTKIYKKSKKISKSKLNHKEFVNFFLNTRSNFIYSARHYARGQRLSGASEIGSIGGRLFYYLGKIKGMEGWESLRNAENHLTKKEWNFLKISSIKSLEKKEIKRAIKANWKYMKYLENLYEKNSGKKLNLKCNDKEILNIINKTIK